MNENLHKGHKKRLRDKALINFDNLEDHEVLELILSMVIVRKNTNDLAHILLEKFGSLYNVLGASFDDLKEVDGVGDKVASFLSLLPNIFDRYKLSKLKTRCKLNSTKDCIEYFESFLCTTLNEEVFCACLNSEYEVIKLIKVSEGVSNNAKIDLKSLIKQILQVNVPYVIFAHSHTNGIAEPSNADIEFTKNFNDVLKGVSIRLLDHIIIADDKGFSFRVSGLIDENNNIVLSNVASPTEFSIKFLNKTK
jgi:DNA repair protein RadC